MKVRFKPRFSQIGFVLWQGIKEKQQMLPLFPGNAAKGQIRCA